MPLIISRQLSLEVSASVQLGGNTSSPNKTELESSLPRFGPCCGKDSEAIKVAKKEAWKHVVRNTPGTDKDSKDSDDSVRGAYLSAIEEVYEAAKYMYPSKAVEGLNQTEFIEMMVDDGCFFLQWAFSVIGGSDLVGYSSDLLYFGEKTRWIEAMFFVGNQIPCVVLHKLLEQTYFKNILKEGKAKKIWPLNPPSDDNLPKMVLYLLLVPPEQVKIGSTWQTIERFVFKRRNKETYFPVKPSDLLDATYRWVLGSTTANMDHKVRDTNTTTTEGDNDEDDDLERGKKESDSKERFQSATELKLSGIKIASTEWGVSKAHFSSLWLFYGRLRMSPFVFDGNSELLLQYLKDYEEAQKGHKNTHEVASYLGFLKDLIQTPIDVELLEHKGVITLGDGMDRNKLPRMLGRPCSSEKIPLTQSLRLAKLRATHYNGPERQAVINITLILTLVQTVVTIVSLNVPGK